MAAQAFQIARGRAKSLGSSGNAVQQASCGPATVRDWLAAQLSVRLGRLDRYAGFRRARRRLVSQLARQGACVRARFECGIELFLPAWDANLMGGVLTGALFEPLLLRIFRKIVRPGSVVVDGGAHVGFCTITAAKLLEGKGRVISFEPDPRNFGLLEQNLSWNRVGDVVSAENVALTDGSRPCSLWRSPDVSTRSSLVPVDGLGDTRLEVTGVSLDEYLAKRGIGRVDVVKLDLEGAEPQAIAGMRRSLASVRLLVFELNGVRLAETGVNPAELVQRVMADGGFTASAVLEEGRACRERFAGTSSLIRILQQRGYCNILLAREDLEPLC